MLVIISDLHLTDGTSGETISADAFRILRERLSDMAASASWRKGDVYKPIEQLDLVLLGDILDPIRSTQWLEEADGTPSRIRPWSHPDDPHFVDKLRAISRAILQKNEDSLKVLRDFNGEHPVSIPPATGDKPRQVTANLDSPTRQRVRVNTHYLVGNHDWFYHLPGPAYDQLRQEIVDAIGLVTPATAPFPHNPDVDDGLQALYAPYRLLARHGDIYDSFNYEGNRAAPSLGDAVVVELLNRFPVEVERQLRGELPAACLRELREVDNVRPLLVVPIWVDHTLRRTLGNGDKRIAKIKDIWDNLADNFLNLEFVRHRDRPSPVDSVDQLEWALKFSKGISFHTASQVSAWFKQKMGGAESTSHQNAFSEAAFLRNQARFIVHGHTHHREIVPLDSQVVGGQRLDKFYFNSGTWRRIHELARFRPTEQEFMGYYEMTYLAFFQGDERKGRPFEVWSGSLGVGDA